MFLSIKLSLAVFGRIRGGLQFRSLSTNVSEITQPQIKKNKKNLPHILYVYVEKIIHKRLCDFKKLLYVHFNFMVGNSYIFKKFITLVILN